MLFATSCQNDEMATAQGGDATVSIAVATPQIATRTYAYSDGTTATELQYAVYDKAGTYLPNVSGTATLENLGTTVELTLTTGNTYDVLFWAAAENAPYTFVPEDKTVTVNYVGAESNAENRDAFFARTTFKVNGKQTETVTLTRPFAQLNIGTADYAQSQAAGYVPAFSKVEVTAYETLNLWNGEVSNPAVRTFDFAAIARDEQFPVVGYEYLAMNYLLVGAAKELVEVKFTYKDEPETYTHSRVVGAVPVQRNYRTNIFGNLLTSEVDVNVTIDPVYADESHDVFYAFRIGGEVNLTQDHLIAYPLIVTSGVDAVLNLNGFSITNTANNPVTDVIIVEEGATLTINGEGTIEAVSGNDGYAVIAEGTVIINGGEYKAGVDENGEANAVVYARGNGEIYVNGGVFHNAHNSAYVLNKKDSDRATTTIEVRGGKFYGFDPANNAAEGAGTDFVAEGHISIDMGEYFVVVPGVIVTNADELNAAAEAGIKYIIFGNDINCGTAPVVFESDVVIYGKGYKLAAGGTKSSKNYGLQVIGAKAEINDLVMNGGGGIYVISGADVTVNNVTLKANYSGYSRHMLYVKNSVLPVNSGEFETLRTTCRYIVMENNAKAYVKGGTWADMMAKDDEHGPAHLMSGSTLEITGGKFQVNVAHYEFDPTPWVAAGYKAERVGNYMEVSAE